MRALVATLLASALLAATARARGRDALCRAAPDVAPVTDVDRALTEASALDSPLDRARARALYLAVLVADPLDEEAAVGLARLDAADGCAALAERGLRAVLARTPRNTEARAALVDLLVARGRWAEARDELDAGLALDPLSVDLLARRARLATWSGDARVARTDLDEATRISPLDPELRSARDRLVLGQARLGQRVQIFPSGYDDIVTTDFAAMQRLGRWRLELGAMVAGRYGALRETRSGPAKTTILDGRPTAGLYRHLENGSWIGGTLGVSAPALALPRFSAAVTSYVPLGSKVAAQMTTAYWRYAGNRDVSILSPAVFVTPTESVELIAKYWLTGVRVRENGTGAQAVSSVGGRVTWRSDPRTSVGLDYVYGLQLERNPLAQELASLRSHIVTLIVQRLVSSTLGVDLALSAEHRENRHTGATAWGPAVEAGVSARW